MARDMDVPAAEMVHICRGAMLHDIGEIGIPGHILRKCAPLTTMEQDMMRMHPIYAYELLSVVPGLHSADMVTLTFQVYGTRSAPLDLSFLNLPVCFLLGNRCGVHRILGA